ncbi:unnamed protein product, partial [Urochloa humidicola]
RDEEEEESRTAEASRDQPKKRISPPMDPMMWHKVAAVSGVAALGLGTYGSHMFRPKNPAYKEVGLAHRVAVPSRPHRRAARGSHRQTPQHFRRASHGWNRVFLWNVLHRGLS